MRLAVLLCCLFTPLSLLAQTPVNLLPENLYGISGNLNHNTSATPSAVSGQSFTQAYRLTVSGTSAKLSDAALQWPTVRGVNAGDNLTLSFWVRKVAPLDGHNIRGQVVFGREGEKAVLATPFPCDSEVWTRYTIPFKAPAAFTTGQARLSFHFAHGPQTFELGMLGMETAQVGVLALLDSHEEQERLKHAIRTTAGRTVLVR